MKKSILALVLVVVLPLVGCASINSVSLTPIPADRKNVVKVEKSKVIILGFNFDNDFVDTIVPDLRSQCPNGKVTGILTKDENINYFLYFVWRKKITATGYCLAGTTARNKGKSRRTASEPNEPAADLEQSEEQEL